MFGSCCKPSWAGWCKGSEASSFVVSFYQKVKNVAQLGKLSSNQGFSVGDSEALPPCGGSPGLTDTSKQLATRLNAQLLEIPDTREFEPVRGQPQKGINCRSNEPILTRALPKDVPLRAFGGFWAISIPLIMFCANWYPVGFCWTEKRVAATCAS